MSTPPSMASSKTDDSANDHFGAGVTKSGRTDTLGKPSIILVSLVICHGFILRQLGDNKVQLCSRMLDETMVLRQEYTLPLSMTKADFEAELEKRFHDHFGIDVTACRKDHGGSGSPRQIDCVIDVEGVGKEERMTRINLPNEETWQAAIGLMRVAKGSVVFKVNFAVDKGKFWERLVVNMFVK